VNPTASPSRDGSFLGRYNDPAGSRFAFSLLTACLTVAALYFARGVFIPLSLAILFAFLLSPLVRRLERWKLGRIPAVVVVLMVSLTAAGGIGWTVINQLLDVVNRLPNYQDNIRRKIETIHGPRGGSLAKATDTVQELSKELAISQPDRPGAELSQKPAKSQGSTAPLPSGGRPVPVELVEPPANALQAVRNLLGPMLAPAGTAVVVVFFTAVILITHEDLRNRLLRLAGRHRLNLATKAFGDANDRVSVYLRLQFLVNATFACVIVAGLSALSLPNALLWGVLAGVLRFLPYFGPMVGAGLPVILSLAVFENWRQPLLCFGLFLVLELLVAYVIEPWLYGNHTGISSLAVLLSAAFWTAVWGPIGLVLSTPLTVCLVVMGRHVQQLDFLYILLGDEPVLAPEAQLYQRLLAMDQQEAQTVVDACLKDKPLSEVYDDLMIPALTLSEEDRHKGILDQPRHDFLVQSLNELIAEFGEPEPSLLSETRETLPSSPPASQLSPYPGFRVVCLPASDKADELAAAMLCQMLEADGYQTVCTPLADSWTKTLQGVSLEPGDIVCVSALPPFSLMSARSLCKRLRQELPKSRIIVGLWNYSHGGAAVENRLARVFPGQVVTTLKGAVEHVALIAEKYNSRPVTRSPRRTETSV
jgi:predicted PurR-regulated permease PerM